MVADCRILGRDDLTGIFDQFRIRHLWLIDFARIRRGLPIPQLTAGLVAGKAYKVKVERTDVNGVARTSAEKKVAVVAGAPGPGLTLTGVRSPGSGELTIRIDSGIWFEGTGLDAWDAATDRIEAKNDSLEEPEYRELTESGAGEAAFADGVLKLDEGAWEVLGPDLEVTEGSQVNFRVTIGGRSAEIVATVSDS